MVKRVKTRKGGGWDSLTKQNYPKTAEIFKNNFSRMPWSKGNKNTIPPPPAPPHHEHNQSLAEWQLEFGNNINSILNDDEEVIQRPTSYKELRSHFKRDTEKRDAAKLVVERFIENNDNCITEYDPTTCNDPLSMLKKKKIFALNMGKQLETLQTNANVDEDSLFNSFRPDTIQEASHEVFKDTPVVPQSGGSLKKGKRRKTKRKPRKTKRRKTKRRKSKRRKSKRR